MRISAHLYPLPWTCNTNKCQQSKRGSINSKFDIVGTKMVNETQEHKEKQNRKRFHLKIVKSFKRASNEMQTSYRYLFLSPINSNKKKGMGKEYNDWDRSKHFMPFKYSLAWFKEKVSLPSSI